MIFIIAGFSAYRSRSRSWSWHAGLGLGIGLGTSGLDYKTAKS